MARLINKVDRIAKQGLASGQLNNEESTVVQQTGSMASQALLIVTQARKVCAEWHANSEGMDKSILQLDRMLKTFNGGR